MATKKQSNKCESVNQLSLNFDVFTIETPADGVVAGMGENAFDAGIRQMLVIALEEAFKRGMSRDLVAEQMAVILGRKVNRAHLDLWTAPSAETRRIPVDALMALMQACNEFSPLDWMAQQYQRKVLTADEALCAEFGAMAVLDRHIKARSKMIESQMDEKLFGHLMEKMKRNVE